jgi:hypothetical protein
VLKDGKNEEFTFHRTGNEAKGYVVRLIKQVAGNLETPEIQAETSDRFTSFEEHTPSTLKPL